ncbi:hypothetical protein [uncultured Cohaesibacter sp.]|uniref:hypothetical protein n=1 Tax=uncultured Cohaesibacter sp. TaxID=1002546 RepID=UPI0029C91334|nr:hypothetical protein [uncultured Cohaesibacter sp.]
MRSEKDEVCSDKSSANTAATADLEIKTTKSYGSEEAKLRATPQLFRQSDIKRALNGAVSAGFGVDEITISRSGIIRLKLKDQNNFQSASPNEWDDVL